MILFFFPLFPLAHCNDPSDVIHHKNFMRFLGWILNMKWRWGLVLWFPCKQITILKLVDALGSLSRRVCVILKKIKITKKRKKKLMSKHPFACCFKFYIFRQEFKKLITVWRDRIVDKRAPSSLWRQISHLFIASSNEMAVMH